MKLHKNPSLFCTQAEEQADLTRVVRLHLQLLCKRNYNNQDKYFNRKCYGALCNFYGVFYQYNIKINTPQFKIKHFWTLCIIVCIYRCVRWFQGFVWW